MKVTIASLILLMLDAIKVNTFDIAKDLRYLDTEVILIWIIGATYARNADTPFKINIGIGANIVLFFGTSDYKVSKAAIANQILLYLVIIVLAVGYFFGIITSKAALLELWNLVFSIFLFCYSVGAVIILFAELIKKMRGFSYWIDALEIIVGIIIIFVLIGVYMSFFIDFSFIGVNPFRFRF